MRSLPLEHLTAGIQPHPLHGQAAQNSLVGDTTGGAERHFAPQSSAEPVPSKTIVESCYAPIPAIGPLRPIMRTLRQYRCMDDSPPSVVGRP